MCKTKMALDVSHPNSPRHPPTRSSDSRRSRPQTPPNFTATTTSTSSSSAASAPSTSNTTTASGYSTTASSSTSSRTSLASLRQNISQNPNIYDISEIRAATNNFLAKRYSSSSTACWRCTLRNIETIVFQRKFRRRMEMPRLKERLAVICRSNHTSVVRLLGVSISGDHIYLVYEFITGGNLADCLRNKRNPNFTVLSSWDSRMQAAADLAHGLDYVHNKTGLNLTLVHNHIKSSSIIITEPDLNAKICHFGTAQLCGEAPEIEIGKEEKKSLLLGKNEIEEINEEDEDGLQDRSKELKRSNSGSMQFEGVRGYMSPEFQSNGTPSQKSDVYAFGVVLLELLSGEEPFKYKYDKSRGDFTRTSLTETARALIGGEGREGREGRLRRWIDGRMKDSFPVEVAEKLVRLALQCVHVEADERPDMSRVAGKISKLYLASKTWSEKTRISDQISVSLAPR